MSGSGAHGSAGAGLSETGRGRIKVYGLCDEIIWWKLRRFGGSDASGVGVRGKVLEH